jgi:hypothetical protein
MPHEKFVKWHAAVSHHLDYIVDHGGDPVNSRAIILRDGIDIVLKDAVEHTNVSNQQMFGPVVAKLVGSMNTRNKRSSEPAK